MTVSPLDPAWRAARCFVSCRPLGMTATLTAMPPGMSGATVYRLDASESSAWALKRLPVEARTSRYLEIHQALAHARAGGCRIVPQMSTVDPLGEGHRVGPSLLDLGADGRWEMSQWMPGRPAWNVEQAERHDEEDLLTCVDIGAEAIARFHQAFQPPVAADPELISATLGNKVGIPEAVAQRSRRISLLTQSLKKLLPPDVSQAAPAAAVWTEAIELLRSEWSSREASMRAVLTRWAERPTPVHMVLRDVHRDHVLFETQAGVPTVGGLIDFDALRIDSPAVDLSRWCGSFLWPLKNALVGGTKLGSAGPLSSTDPAGGFTDLMSAIWSRGMAGYRRICPFSPRQEQLSRDLVAVSTSIALANWVTWVVLERRSFSAGPGVLVRRMEELIWLWRAFADDS